MRPEVVDAERAVACIEDGATISVGGAGAGHSIPEKVLVALVPVLPKRALHADCMCFTPVVLATVLYGD